MIIFALIILLAFLAYADLSLNWAIYAYDEWRLIQFVIFACMIAVLFLQKQYHTSKTMLVGLILLSFMAVSVCYAPYPLRALVDGCIYLLLYYLILSLIPLLKQNQARRDIFFLILALLPLLSALWLPLAIIISSSLQIPMVDTWHGGFLNFRYYNDALLPSLFLLWAQPAFLKKYPKIVLAISTLYLWVIWTDGARAVMLGIIVALILATFLQKKNIKQLKIPLLSLFISFFLYQVILYFDIVGIDIARSSSSGRSEIWQQYFSRFLEHPLSGIGANNIEGIRFLNDALVMHPHNIVLQWLTEWGFAGVFVLALLLYFAIKLIKYRQYLPFFALAGCIAITINILLSGSMVYPISQIFNVLVFAWAISYFPTAAPTNTQKVRLWQKSYLYALIFFSILFTIHYEDIFQYKTSSGTEDDIMAPRVWQYGQADHLNHYDEPIEYVLPQLE